MTIVVTGASGYVGSRVAAAYRARGERVVTPDLRDLSALSAVDRRSVRHIVHCAAVTRFDVSREVATAVNVGLTERVLRFADTCSSLEAVGLASTVYASGLRSGRIAENLGDNAAGFANEYERSKWEAERLAAVAYGDLPVRVLRLATVVADDTAGTVSQQNAFHTTLRLVFYGLLSLVPGEATTPVHVISGRYAVDAILAVMDDEEARGTHHLTPKKPISLGDLLDMAWARFEADPDVARRRLMRPLLVDADSFDDLSRESAALGASVAGQAVAAMGPFARQLYVHKDVVAEKCPVAPDEPAPLVAAAIDHLVRTRWGRRDVVAA